MRIRILCGLVITICLLLGLQAAVRAEGILQVEGGESGTDYTYEGGLLTIQTDTPLTISGSTTTDRVVVAAEVAADITLDNVSIVNTTAGVCSFEIVSSSTADVSITLAGTNLLQSGANCAGLEKNGDDRTLFISGDGSLTAIGGENSAGIGGSNSWVTINGGTITAYGGNNTAGIGGDNGFSGGYITINGGTVTAAGGENGAGIGGGMNGSGGYITINGGIVTATGNNGAGIGGGYNGGGGTINISGGIVTATGGTYAAGIGNGRYAANGNVSISGSARVFAKGDFTNDANDIGGGTAGGAAAIMLSISDTAAVFLYNGDALDESNVTCADGHVLSASMSYASSLYGITPPEDWSAATGIRAYLRLVTLDYDANAGDGTAPSSQHQHIGTSTILQAGDGLSRTDYTFDGWNTLAGGDGMDHAPGESFTYDTDTTLYAKWVPVQYSISYDLAGGTVSEGNPDSYNIESPPATLNNPAKTGYTFAGWTGTELLEPTMNVTVDTGSTGNREYTATWTVNTYTVNFDCEGGTASPTSKMVTYDSLYGALPEPTKAGFSFSGWWTGDNGTDMQVTEENMVATADDHTLYAKWTAKVAVSITLTAQSYTYDGTEKIFTITGTPSTGFTVEYYVGAAWTETPPANAGRYNVRITRAEDATYAAYASEELSNRLAILSSVSYYDVEGNEHTVNADPVTSETTALSEALTQWYVVEGDVTINTTLTVTGSVNLILTDGASLSVNGSSNKAGINVSSDNSLTIFGQENSTGSLTATANSNGVGIGATGIDNSCGTVIINGGNVSALGVWHGAGIGGGGNAHGGNVIINGGTVYARGYGAGIGGGRSGYTEEPGGNGGTVTINGGTVIAVSWDKGAGIGGGGGTGGIVNSGTGGTVAISGDAVVFARGKELKDIGSGISDGTLSISDTAAVFLYNGSGPVEVTCPSGHTRSASMSYASSLYGITPPEDWSAATGIGAYLRLVTLDYDTNGGDGTAPSSQQQHIGTTGTIQAGSGISRIGCTFSNWMTTGDEGYIYYDPGDSFVFEEDTTLSAWWTVNSALYIGSNNVADTDGDIHYWKLSDNSATETGTTDEYDFSVRYTGEGEDKEFILTLNGVDITSYLDFNAFDKMGVYSNIALTIVLAEGSQNGIMLNVPADYYTHGVYTDGDLTVTGNGSLEVTMSAEVGEEGYSATGFYADNVNINSGDITVTVSGGAYAIGMYASDNMTVSCGEITVQAINALMEAIAIKARGDFGITDGDISCMVTSTGYAAGILAGDEKRGEGSVSITGGTITSEVIGGTSSYGIIGYYGVNISGGDVSSVSTMTETGGGDFGAIAIGTSEGNLTITGGEITASAEGGGHSTIAILAFNDSVSISGGTVTSYARNDNSAIGIGAAEDISITSGTVNTTAISNEEGTASGLHAVNVNFEEGSITASAFANEENPFSTSIAVNIREDGFVNIAAENYRHRTDAEDEYLIYPDTSYVHSSSPYTQIATMYTVDYHYNYGEQDVFESKQAAYATHPAAPETTPVREYYTFSGWYKSSACTPIDAVDFETYMIIDAVTLYAGWTPTEYSVSYNLAGGTVGGNIASYNVESSSITLNNPMRNGYEFAGWTGTGLLEPTMTVTIDSGSFGNREYTATWTKLSDDSDDDDTGGGGGSPSTPTATVVIAEVVTGGGSGSTLPVTVNAGNRTASVDLGSGYLTQDRTTIKIPSISEVDTYTVGIPVPLLSTTGEKGLLTLDTDAGSVTVPSNMLTGAEGASGRKAEISIGQKDKNTLPDDVKTAIGDRPLVQLTLSIDGKQTDWSNPSAPVTVSISYTPTSTELMNPESIVVWYIDGSGNVTTIPNGRYEAASGTVTFSTSHFSYFALTYNPVSFNDVTASAWYNKAVSFIAARKITSGTGDGTTYSPESKLTRGEFIVLMMRAYGIESDTSPTDNFSDAGDTYYTGYLAAAKRLGITAGVGNNMYAPGNLITRQEMFTLLYNALKVIDQLPQGDSGKSIADFTDAGQISSWAQRAMALLVRTGTVSGSNGMLTPINTTTRAEMAQVLFNLTGK